MSYVKVYKYKQQVSYDQGETWEDTGEYVPSGDPIGYYDTYEDCIAQYRTVSTGRTCSGTHGVDLYELVEYQASYDDGITWTTISSTTGSLIEANSSACGYRTRTTSGTAYCTGYDKYQDVYSQVSYDNGNTWTTTATTPTLVELNSEDCGYLPPFNGKYKLTLSDSSTASAECDSTSAISMSDISAYSASVTSAVIGDCVSGINYNAFMNCTNLTSVTIPNSVTSIGSDAFYQCTSLANIDIPNSVTSIGNSAFQGCTSLSSVTIPNGITSIEMGVFHSCSGLTSVTIPSGVTSIGVGAFYDCSSLTSITIYATTPTTLENYAFDNTNNCPIYVPCASVDTYKAASGWSDYASRIEGIPPCGSPTPSYKWLATYTGGTTSSAECDSTSAITQDEIALPSLTDVVVGDCVTSVGDNAFIACTSLSSVTMSDSIATIGQGAFNGCSSLTSCTIGNGITSIGEFAFGYCSNLVSVTVNATTPPTLKNTQWGEVFEGTPIANGRGYIYVPSGSVNTYKAASGWSTYSSRIQAIP